MHHPVVRVAAPGEVGMRARHPRVECIVHEEICKDGADHATLRRSLVSFHKRAIRSLKWSCQPALDVKLNPLASVVLPDCPHQEVVADIVKETSHERSKR